MDTKQLKAEVERIVEPVRAEMRLKNKFRQELWAHLSELYEEESASAPDAEAAAHVALERLGDPDELRAQLRASMKFIDRIEGFGGYWMRPRTGVPLFPEMLRIGISVFFLAFGLIIMFLAGLWTFSEGLKPGEAWYLVALVTSTSVIIAEFATVFGSIEGATPRISRNKSSRRRLSKKTIQWSALWVLVFLASGVVVHVAGHAFLVFALGPDNNFVIHFDIVNPVLWRLLGGTTLIGLLVVLLGEMYFSGRLPDWPYADAA